MAPSSPPTWWLRSSTFVVAALAGASAVWWVLQLRGGTAQVPAVPPFAAAQADPAALLTILGAHENAGPAAAPGNVSIDLIGVVTGPAGKGYALLSVAGAPAKAFGLGATVAPGLVLQSLMPRGAALGPSGGSASVQLSLPALAKP
jgi:general secretion pathway protein C